MYHVHVSFVHISESKRKQTLTHIISTTNAF